LDPEEKREKALLGTSISKELRVLDLFKETHRNFQTSYRKRWS